MSSRLPEATGLLHRKQPLALCRAYSTKPRCPARQGHLQCRAGILDKYREEKGIASPGASSTGVLQRPQLPSQQQEDDDEEGEDEGVCTTECVREFTTEAQFERILHDAGPDSLVVVDFFRTACGSCKYIGAGFLKLCNISHEEHAPVHFAKSNVFDEYEEPTPVAERLKIKVVPSFYFYKNGVIVEQFATREKSKLAAAINKHVGHHVV